MTDKSTWEAARDEAAKLNASLFSHSDKDIQNAIRVVARVSYQSGFTACRASIMKQLRGVRAALDCVDTSAMLPENDACVEKAFAILDEMGVKK